MPRTSRASSASVRSDSAGPISRWSSSGAAAYRDEPCPSPISIHVALRAALLDQRYGASPRTLNPCSWPSTPRSARVSPWSTSTPGSSRRSPRSTLGRTPRSSANSSERVLAGSGVDRRALSGVVAGMGPGPFTGLRVGIAAARAFAFGISRPVVPVVSHDAIAFGRAHPTLVVTDARRREVAWSRYAAPDELGLPVRIGGTEPGAPGRAGIRGSGSERPRPGRRDRGQRRRPRHARGADVGGRSRLPARRRALPAGARRDAVRRRSG